MSESSTVAATVIRGRGGESLEVRRLGKRGGQFESLQRLPHQRPGDAAKSIEGWVLFVTGLPAEAKEGDLMDAFAPHGIIRNIRMHTDRNGQCVGHALVEYESEEECRRCIGALSGQPFLSSPAVSVNAAFIVEEDEETKLMKAEDGEVKIKDEKDDEGAKKRGRD